MNTIITAFMLIPAMFALTEIQPWQVQDYWGKLEVKMTEQVVIELLGEPLEKETVNSARCWYYQQAPKRVGDKVISRPRYGFLRFRKNGSACLLKDWKEPDWTVITPQKETQYLAEQRRIESLRKVEEAQQLREEQKRIREAESQRLAAEREAQQQQRIREAESKRLATARKLEQQQRLTEQEQRRAKQEKLRQQQLAKSKVAQARSTGKKKIAKPDTHIQITSKYFIAIGIIFMIISFIIAGSHGFKLFRD